MSDETPKIEPRDNGPLIAKNIPKLVDRDGAQVDGKPLYALCRCGQSKTKPFCDGSHNAGFDSSPSDVAHRDRIYPYQGGQARVYFNKLLCSHAGECGKRAAHIFNTKQRPWVQPDEGTLDEIRQVVAACPSGALRWSEPDSEEPIAITHDEVEITIEPNGPYHVRNIDVPADYWADGQSPKKYVLCRCGLSKNKPFCDGTHYDEGWRDT